MPVSFRPFIAMHPGMSQYQLLRVYRILPGEEFDNLLYNFLYPGFWAIYAALPPIEGTPMLLQWWWSRISLYTQNSSMRLSTMMSMRSAIPLLSNSRGMFNVVSKPCINIKLPDYLVCILMKIISRVFLSSWGQSHRFLFKQFTMF